MSEQKAATMDDIVSLSKRRGFVYPGSEIYGGEAGLYDFGPYGVELLNNIKKSWWRRRRPGPAAFCRRRRLCAHGDAVVA